MKRIAKWERALRALYVSVAATACVGGLGTVACSSSSSPAKPPPSPGPLGSRPDLPVDGQVAVSGLSGPVDIVTDEYGAPHIYATTMTDAMRVEGYLVARDRAVQLDALRRTAEGRTAELLGQLDPTSIDSDIAFRQLGLARVAAAQYAALPPGEAKDSLDAYADGITQVMRALRAGTMSIPSALAIVPTQVLTDWTPVDSLAVARFESFLVSYDADLDLQNDQFFQAIRGAFSASDGDPRIAKRAGLERDIWRFAPLDPTSEMPNTQHATSPRTTPPVAQASRRAARMDTAATSLSARAFTTALRAVKDRWAPQGFGSNGWAVAPSLSATGHALLASDPHLALDAPSVFWPVSITVGAASAAPSTQMSGVSMPGIPGILLGHNGSVAWGSTVVGYDVTDVYREALSSDGQSVTFKGQAVPLQTVDETILINGGAPLTYHVKIVPHHGAILPNIVNHAVVDPSGEALSVRWTGQEATEELPAVLSLAHAKTVDDAVAALAPYATGGQNWIFADTTGGVAWTSQAHIPLRDRGAFTWDAATYSGNLPCFTLPGDGSAEWTGYLESSLVPATKNPASSFFISANNDPTGDSADNDPSNAVLPDGRPMYWACSFDVGYRAGRIQQRITSAGKPLTTDDFASIQGDIHSAFGARFTPLLLSALDRAAKERQAPGTYADMHAVANDPAYDPARIASFVQLLTSWGTDSDYTAASGLDPATNQPLADTGADADGKNARASEATLLFNLWMRNCFIRTFGDEYAKAGMVAPHDISLKALAHLLMDDPHAFATYDATLGDSVLWDDLGTDAVESRGDRIVRAVLDTFAWMDRSASSSAGLARWGAHHTVTFAPMLGPLPSIPAANDTIFPNGFPRGGDEYSVDASSYRLASTEANPDFHYVTGPAQRFVIDLDPAGPHVLNALPGGSSSDPASAHYRDEAEYWRTNRNHPVPFSVSEVVAAKESRTVAVSQ
jgi:penicillin amidase